MVKPLASAPASRPAGQSAQHDRWTSLLDSAGGAVKKRRYREAAEHLEEALVIAEAAWPNSARSSESAVRLARVCVMLSLEGRAESLYRQALLATGVTRGEFGAVFVEGVGGLGRLYLLREEIDKAEPLIRRSMELGAALRGSDFASVPIFLNMAMLHATTGQDEDAERMFEEAIEALEHGEHGDEVEAIGAYDNYALYRIGRGDLEAAEPLYRRALILRQETVGPGHPVYAAGLVNLGRLQYRRGVLDEAETLMWQAADVFEGKRLAAYSGHLPVFYYLALMAHANQQRDEANALCGKLRSLTESDTDAGAPARAATLHVEGRFHLERRQFSDAEARFRQALDIAGESSPVHRRFTAGILAPLLDDLAGLLRGDARSAEAEHINARAEELAGAIDWSLGRRVFTAG